MKDYPGTPQHQALLRAIVNYYADDARVQAVVLFGSLVHGNWDRYSDLDLDVVIDDGVIMNACHELTQLCDSFHTLGEHAALIIPDEDDAGDVVLESLMELSVRFHRLCSTHPNVVDTMQLLTGRIDESAIKSAGLANRHPKQDGVDSLLDRCVRYAVEANVALHRRRIWSAVDFLHRMRALLMELYAQTYNGSRALQFFQTTADPELQFYLGATLPSYDLRSVIESLKRFIDFLEHDLDQLTQGQIQLCESQRQLLAQVRLRQTDLKLGVENANQNR